MQYDRGGYGRDFQAAGRGGYGGDFQAGRGRYGADFQAGRAGYGRDYPMARASGPPRGYDYGLRGYSQTAPTRRPIPLRTYGRGGYDRGYFGQPALPNRVTQRYNREYVHPEPNRFETNYAPFGGDVEDRIVDHTGYWGAYNTTGGSRTWRGGNLPMGWEREAAYRGRYDRELRGYGRDYYGPMR